MDIGHNIKAIFFDLDGVLTDVTNIHQEALNYALNEYGYSEINSKQFRNSEMLGLSSFDKLKLVGIPENTIPEIVNLKDIKAIQITQKITEDETNRYKNINEKLNMLKQLRTLGIKLACVTNSVKTFAENILNTVKQKDMFDVIVTREDVQNRKPNPDCYLLAMKLLDVDGDSVLSIEDSEKGKRAAETAGIRYVWKVNNSQEVTIENVKMHMEKTGELACQK